MFAGMDIRRFRLLGIPGKYIHICYNKFCCVRIWILNLPGSPSPRIIARGGWGDVMWCDVTKKRVKKKKEKLKGINSPRSFFVLRKVFPKRVVTICGKDFQ